MPNRVKQPSGQESWQQARLSGMADLHSLTEAARELNAVATSHHPEAKH